VVVVVVIQQQQQWWWVGFLYMTIKGRHEPLRTLIACFPPHQDDTTTTTTTATTPTATATTKHLYVVHCSDDLSCGMVEASPRGGSRKRIGIYEEHKVSGSSSRSRNRSSSSKQMWLWN